LRAPPTVPGAYVRVQDLRLPPWWTPWTPPKPPRAPTLYERAYQGFRRGLVGDVEPAIHEALVASTMWKEFGVSLPELLTMPNGTVERLLAVNAARNAASKDATPSLPPTNPFPGSHGKVMRESLLKV